MMAGLEHDGLTDLARDPVGTGTEMGELGSGDSRLDEGAVLFRNELVVADAAAGAAGAVKWVRWGVLESMPRLWCWPSAAARGSRLLLRQMGVSELAGRPRRGGR